MGDALNGRTALVTGAGSGIGAATARLLAQDGATVLMMGRREALLRESREALLEQVPGARLEIFAGDATKEADVRAALAKAHSLAGRLDMLAATIGGGKVKPLLLQDAATFMRDYELNVVSAFLLVRYGVPLMAPGGSIVCISTAVAVQPFPGLSSYAAAKAGLERFVKAAALELGGARIRINAVRPGMTRSPTNAYMYANPDLVKRYESETILGRTGEPEDIARAVRFFAGPESGWVTGQSISADGGQEQGKIPDMLDAIYGKDVMDQVRAGRPPVVDAAPGTDDAQRTSA
jgi:NAD(P)-dependent dehydrogenase (short-subunit alcohol dehydrogenase family)